MQEYYFLVINNKEVPWEYFWQKVRGYFFKEYVKELATNRCHISFQNLNFEVEVITQEFQSYDVIKFSSEVNDNLGTYYNIPELISQILVYWHQVVFYEIEKLEPEQYYNLCKNLDKRVISPKIMALMFKFNHSFPKYSPKVSDNILVIPTPQVQLIKVKKVDSFTTFIYCDRGGMKPEEFWFKVGEYKSYDYAGFVFEPIYAMIDKEVFSNIFSEYFEGFKYDIDCSFLVEIDIQSSDFFAICIYDEWDRKTYIVGTKERYYYLDYSYIC